MYKKQLFNPESNTEQIELNDPEFWEKLLQNANADMLLQRLQDVNVMQDANSVKIWMRDLEKLVKELCEEEDYLNTEFLQHEIDTTSKILIEASSMVTVFGKHACKLMMSWIDDVEKCRFKRRNKKTGRKSFIHSFLIINHSFLKIIQPFIHSIIHS